MTRPMLASNGESYETGELPPGSGAVRNMYLEKAMRLHPNVMVWVRTCQTMREHRLPPPVVPGPAPQPLPRTASLPRFDPREPPDCFSCSIDSGTPVMTQPVTAADGMTYQKSAIAAYLALAGDRARSPLTGVPLLHTGWVPNRALEAAMQWHPQVGLQQRAVRTLEMHQDAQQATLAGHAARALWRQMLLSIPHAAALATVGSWLGGYAGSALQAGFEAAVPAVATRVGWGNALVGTYVGAVMTAATLARGMGRQDVAERALRLGIHGVAATALVIMGATVGAATLMGVRTIDCIMEGEAGCLVRAGYRGALFGALVVLGLVAVLAVDEGAEA